MFPTNPNYAARIDRISDASERLQLDDEETPLLESCDIVIATITHIPTGQKSRYTVPMSPEYRKSLSPEELNEFVLWCAIH